MKPHNLTELTDTELLKQAKKSRSTSIYDSVIFGFLVGIAAYSSVKNGFGLLTFLPLIYLPIAAKNHKRKKGLERLLKERGLK